MNAVLVAIIDLKSDERNSGDAMWL